MNKYSYTISKLTSGNFHIQFDQRIPPLSLDFKERSRKCIFTLKNVVFGKLQHHATDEGIAALPSIRVRIQGLGLSANSVILSSTTSKNVNTPDIICFRTPNGVEDFVDSGGEFSNYSCLKINEKRLCSSIPNGQTLQVSLHDIEGDLITTHEAVEVVIDFDIEFVEQRIDQGFSRNGYV